MKKIAIFIMLLFVVTGCSKNNNSDVKNKILKGLNNLDSYYLEGDLELRNNDEVYNYDVNVSFEKKSNFKVSLTNKSNDSTQVILKNKDGVYILTPALNRSFKFQSDWPYNNSQVYLLSAIGNDIKEEKDLSIKKNKNNIILKTKVNYPNNSNLSYQKIYFDNNYKLKKIVVYDKDDVPCMEFKISKIDYSPSFDKNYFDLKSIMKTFSLDESELKETMTLEDSIYPLFLPKNTSLSNEERIKKTNGDRILMTFDGDSPFLLVEETANYEEDFTIIPTNGKPFQLMDTLGVMTDNSLNWVSNGIEYYLVSDVLTTSELIDIAQSIYVLPTMK